MKTKAKTVAVHFTKREAEALFSALDTLFEEYPGGPSCPKCAKALWRAIQKIDEAFEFGVLES